MSVDLAKTRELELDAARIRRSVQHYLTAPRVSTGDSRHAWFCAVGSNGNQRSGLTAHAIELSAAHVIGECEPRVTDLVVKPKLQRGKLVSMAVSYTIRSSKKRDTLAIAYAGAAK